MLLGPDSIAFDTFPSNNLRIPLSLKLCGFGQHPVIFLSLRLKV